MLETFGKPFGTDEKELELLEEKRRRRGSYDHRERGTLRELAKLLGAAMLVMLAAFLIRTGSIPGEKLEELLLADRGIREAQYAAARVEENLRVIGQAVFPDALRKDGGEPGEGSRRKAPVGAKGNTHEGAKARRDLRN